MLYLIITVLAFATTANLSEHDTFHCRIYNRSRSTLLGWTKFMPILALGIIFRAEDPNKMFAIIVGIIILFLCMIYSHYLDSEKNKEKDESEVDDES